MNEIWKDIPAYEGLYQVSNKGKIRGLPREVRTKGGATRITPGKILKYANVHESYSKVDLSKNGVKTSLRVHVLVAMAFLNHKPGGRKTQVDHIDNDKTNNALSNIQLISARENSSKDRSRYLSKHTGVYFIKSSKRFRAKISVKGKSRHLGCFDTETKAAQAYKQALNTITQKPQT